MLFHRTKPDPRVNGIFSSLLGDDFQYLGSDGNYYVGDTSWHSDGGWPRPIIYYKMALYLDPLTRETGALRVIPGSHRYGEGYAEEIHQLVRESEEQWGIGGSEVPAMVLETNPGDVVVFNQGTKHSTWGGGDRRRMFTFIRPTGRAGRWRCWRRWPARSRRSLRIVSDNSPTSSKEFTGTASPPRIRNALPPVCVRY